jgi:hypothetical protein
VRNSFKLPPGAHKRAPGSLLVIPTNSSAAPTTRGFQNPMLVFHPAPIGDTKLLYTQF